MYSSYSHHLYNNYDQTMNISRDVSHAHPLGRPASLKSHYPSPNIHSHSHTTSSTNNSNNQPNDNHTIDTINNGNDGHSLTETHDTHHVGSCISYVNAGSWHSHANNNNISSWNHNQSDCDNNNTSNLSSSHPPSLSLSLHNNHHNNNINSNNNTTHSASSTSINNTLNMTSNNNMDQTHSSSNRPETIHDLPSLITQDKNINHPSQTISPILNSPPTTASSIMSAYNSPSYFVPPTSTGNTGYSHHSATSHGNAHQSNSSDNYSYGYNPNMPARHNLVGRPKLTTTLWEDENTICYQVDANGICVARRHDNDMINGTKLLNVAGMSRGKRDGILKNEKGRVVVKVGAMHLKGVWITFARAKLLAAQYKIQDTLYPLFVDDPSVFLYATNPHNPMASNRFNGLASYRHQQQYSSNAYSANNNTTWDRHSTDTSHTNLSSPPQPNYKNANNGYHSSMGNHPLNSNDDMFILQSQVDYNRSSISGNVNYHNSNNASNATSYYPPQQRTSTNRMYFNDDLLDDGRGEIKSDPLNESSSFYVQKPVLPNNAASETIADKSITTLHSSAFHLPSSRLSATYDSSSDQSSRRQSTISNTSRLYNPRHHPYMTPNKLYSPGNMSTPQSYRSSTIDYSGKSHDENNGN